MALEVRVQQRICSHAAVWAGVQDFAVEVDSHVRIVTAKPHPLKYRTFLATLKLLFLQIEHHI